MSNCNHFQSRVWDHLYGLLDEAESLALIEHVGSCEECRDGLLRADTQKHLLAAASHTEFAGLRFVAPTPGERATPHRAPRRLAFPTAWQSYAVAAAVLLAVVGLTVPLGQHMAGVWGAKADMANADRRLDELRKEERLAVAEHAAARREANRKVKEVEAERQRLTEEQEKAFQAAQAEIKAHQLVLVLTGPENIRAGESATFTLETKSLTHAPAEAQLSARVRDKTTRKVVFEQTNIASKGGYKLELPGDLMAQGGNNLALEVVAVGADGARGELSEQLTLSRPGFVTHLFTDKPIYQPGQTIRFRSLTLDRFSLKPPTEDLALQFALKAPPTYQPIYQNLRTRVEQTTREGKVVAVVGPDRLPVRGVAFGEYYLDKDAPGGEYILEVSDPSHRFPTERRKIIVNKYQELAFNKELKFDRESYGLGEKVTATLKVERADGGQALANKEVLATVTVDGVAYQRDGSKPENADRAKFAVRTDDHGVAVIQFTLPAKSDKGDASLNLEFAGDGLARPIVIANKLFVEFFPEGGALVAGASNRVYFQAHTPLGKPASLRGVIVDDAGNEVPATAVHTLNDPKEPGINQGTGAFTFVPAVGQKYRLKVVAPAAITDAFELPTAVAEGVVLNVPTGVTTDLDPIHVVLNNVGKERELLVGAYCRGRLLDYKMVAARAGQPLELDLKPTKDDVGGVYRVTVFEKQDARGTTQLKPVAERLVYRSSGRKLNLTVKADKPEYLPRDFVHLSLQASGETGQSLPAILMVGVVNKSVLSMADERTARTMPTHFLLTSEVRNAEDLEYTDVLLGEHAKAKEALDLLLGTQGWRRFLESDPARLKNSHEKIEEMRCQVEDVDRLKVAWGLLAPVDGQTVADSTKLKEDAIIERFRPQFNQLQTQTVRAWEDAAAAQNPHTLEAKKQAIWTELEQVKASSATAVARLRDYDQTAEVVRSRAFLFFGLLLLVAGAGSLLVGLNRSPGGAMPFYAGAVGSLAVCGLVLLGTFLVEVGPQTALTARGPEPKEAPGFAAPGAADQPTQAPGGGGNQGIEQWIQEAAALEDDGRAPRPFNAPARKAGENKAAKDVKPNEVVPAPAPVVELKKQDEKEGPRADAARDRQARPGGKQPIQPQKDKLERQEPRDGADGKKFGVAAAIAPIGGRPDGKGDGEELAKQFRGMPVAPQMPPGVNYLQLAALAKRRAQAKEEADLDQLQAVPTCYLRDYSHRVSAPDKVRSDVTETVLWQPVLVLPDGGCAESSFQLPDSVTRFQVIVFGHTTDGRLGSNIQTELPVRKPFSMSAKVPAEVTANDLIDLPVTLDNPTDKLRRVKLALQLEGLALTSGSAGEREEEVTAHAQKRVVFHLKPSIRAGKASVTLKATAEPFGEDAVTYPIKVVAEGFPVNGQVSDILEGGHAQFGVTLPEGILNGSLQAELTLYPSPLAGVQRGLEGLLREPNGCFEQTSTSNYPNVLILNYLQESNQSNPQLEGRARDLLHRGYAKLVSFECQKAGGNGREGYEWFGGQAPAHEALTAYGLMEFRDMLRIGYPVDKTMIERTEKYLLDQRDGNGGFKRNARALDSFGRAPDHITNAYIVWALTEGETDMREKLVKELDALTKQAADSRDPYFLALIANSLRNTGRDATAVLKQLVGLQKKDGVLDGAVTSITASGGRDLQIETTSLAVLAWAKENRPDYRGCLDQGIRWISQQRGGYGGFGSTQSTILALKALLVYAKSQKGEQVGGPVKVLVNGVKAGEGVFDPKANGPISIAIADPAKLFNKAENEVEIEFANGAKSTVPYTLGWSCQTLKPLSAAQCPVRLEAKLSKTEATDGETVHMTVTVTNTSDKGQGMAVAIVGLPAGLNLPENLEQLRQHIRLRDQGTKDGVISAFEVRGRELVLYWRSMAPKAQHEVPIDLICRVPGEYRGPASRAYLYYNADAKHWVAPITANVRPTVGQ